MGRKNREVYMGNKLKKKLKVEVIKPNYSIHQTPTTSFYKELERKEDSMKVFMEKEYRV